MSEQIQANVRIVSGVAKVLWGRLVGDGHRVASGRVEQLSGEAALACARARSRAVREGSVARA